MQTEKRLLEDVYLTFRRPTSGKIRCELWMKDVTMLGAVVYESRFSRNLAFVGCIKDGQNSVDNKMMIKWEMEHQAGNSIW
jgi:hypothetical protein